MKCRRFTGLVLAVALTAATDGWAGSWATQATLANNAYQGSVSLDASAGWVAACGDADAAARRINATGKVARLSMG